MCTNEIEKPRIELMLPSLWVEAGVIVVLHSCPCNLEGWLVLNKTPIGAVCDTNERVNYIDISPAQE